MRIFAENIINNVSCQGGLDKTASMWYNIINKEIKGIFMGVHLKVVPTSFSRQQNHELAKVLKLLQVESPSAVAALVELLYDKDPKIKMAAASKLLDTQVNIALQINNDQIQRLEADAKYGLALNGSTANSDKDVDEDDVDDGLPLVDFNTIQTV